MVEWFFRVVQGVVIGFFLGVFLARAVTKRNRGNEAGTLLAWIRKPPTGLELSYFLAFFLIVLIMLWLNGFLPGFLFPAWWGWRFEPGIVLRLLGIGLIVVGFFFYLSGLRAMGDSWRLGIDPARPGQLVKTGIFVWTRNPIYLFFDLFALAAFLINGAGILLILAILVFVLFHWQILREERFLDKQFGAKYSAYLECVPRYLSCGALRFVWQEIRDR